MHLDSVTPPNPPDADQSPARQVDLRELVRRALGAAWSGLRQVAWGIDAFSSVSHGMDVPPDHPARARSAARAGEPRRRRTA